MSGGKIPTSELQFRFGKLMSKHGARILVALFVLALVAVGGAAGEGGDLVVSPSGTESGDSGP